MLPEGSHRVRIIREPCSLSLPSWPGFSGSSGFSPVDEPSGFPTGKPSIPRGRFHCNNPGSLCMGFPSPSTRALAWGWGQQSYAEDYPLPQYHLHHRRPSASTASMSERHRTNAAQSSSSRGTGSAQSRLPASAFFGARLARFNLLFRRRSCRLLGQARSPLRLVMSRT